MNNERKGIINVITSPLGFFALALLIVEGFLSIVLVFSKLSNSLNFSFWGMITGAILFTIVVVLVWVLVWFRPMNLTLEGKHHVELEKLKESRYLTAFDEKDTNTTKRNPEEIQKNLYKNYIKRIHE